MLCYKKEKGENMRQMLISSVKELEDLRKILKGDKILEVKIGNLPESFTIDALDLNNFQGKLTISFLEKKSPHTIKVRTCNRSSCVNLFEHARLKKITIEQNGNWHFEYVPIIKKIEISTEEQLLTAIKNATREDKVKLVLEEDIVITQVRNIKVPSYLEILYGKYKIYVPQSSRENFKKSRVEYYNSFLSIKDISDLEKLKTMPNGVVVAKIKKDIENFVLQSISLETFYGHLIILGNNHTFSNGLIDGPGLISVLPNTASLTVKDLTLKQIVVNAENTDYVGAFLGTHYISPYASFLGEILFENCRLENSYIKRGRKDTGAFVGRYDEFMASKNSTVSNVYSETRDLTGLFGREIPYTTISYEPEDIYRRSLTRRKN